MKRSNLIILLGIAFFIVGGLLVWWILPEGSEGATYCETSPLLYVIIFLLLLNLRRK